MTLKGRGSFWIFAGAGLLTVVAMAAFEAPSFVSSQLSGANANQNVPPPLVFQKILRRDLLAFFSKSGITATKVDLSLIRDPALRSAAAPHGYYAWVRAYAGDDVVREGAVSVSAVDRTRFDVTHFLERSSIMQDPAQLDALFPEPVAQSVLERARNER